MASKVELGAVACGALDAGAAEVQVAGKLGDVLAAGPDADMQRVGASGLDELAHLLVLLHGGEEGGVADGLVVLLNAVDEHLDGEVGTAFGLDAAHDLADEAGAALEGLRAVVVLALVAVAGHEGLADILAGGVDLHAVEAAALQGGGGLDGVGDEVLDLLGRHVHAVRGLEDGRGVGLETAEHEAHGGQLVAGGGTVVLDVLGEGGQVGIGPVGEFAHVGNGAEMIVEFCEVIAVHH